MQDYLTRPAVLHTPNTGANAKNGENKERNKCHQPFAAVGLQIENCQHFKGKENHVFPPGEDHSCKLTRTVCLCPGKKCNSLAISLNNTSDSRAYDLILSCMALFQKKK